MIDILHAKQEFKKYVSHYDPSNGRIALKIGHIERVAMHCRTIATNLGLSDEETNLAELIGIFHDIGRFEQVKIANTFSDKESGINHAEKSIEILFKNAYIRNYIQDNKYDTIIRLAILNHNRAQIDPNLSKKELLFSKIIRDADKLDIFYTLVSSPLKDIFWYEDFTCERINPLVLDDFKNSQSLINYANIHNNADQILIFFAYIYDLNFPTSLNIVARNDYLNQFAKRLKKKFLSPTIHAQVDEILMISNQFLKQYMY